jgi:hypothetical protein
MADVGLLCYLTGIRTARQAREGPLAGAIFETAVVAEVVRTLTHLVLANGVLEQLGAHTSRDERRDQDVRVENQPHGTRSKTSSSVKMPCA